MVCSVLFMTQQGAWLVFPIYNIGKTLKILIVWNLNAKSLDIWYVASSSGSLPSLFKMASSWGWHDLHIKSIEIL